MSNKYHPLLSLAVQGAFKMDSRGTGVVRKQLDREFVLIFEPRASGSEDGVPHYFTVHGRGVSDYGAFIVQGKFNNKNSVLEVVRVFMTEDDVRGSMSLTQLRDWFRQGGTL